MRIQTWLCVCGLASAMGAGCASTSDSDSTGGTGGTGDAARPVGGSGAGGNLTGGSGAGAAGTPTGGTRVDASEGGSPVLPQGGSADGGVDQGTDAADLRECPRLEPSGDLGECTADLEGLVCWESGCLRNSPDPFSVEYRCEAGQWMAGESSGADCNPPDVTCRDIGAVPGGDCPPEMEDMGCDRSPDCPDGPTWSNYLVCDGSHWSMGDECL